MNKRKFFKWLDEMMICCYVALMGLFFVFLIEHGLFAQDREGIIVTNKSAITTNEVLGLINLSGWSPVADAAGITNKSAITTNTSFIVTNAMSLPILTLTNQAYIKVDDVLIVNVSSNEWNVLTNHYRKFLNYHDLKFYDNW
jgi:hypothetical protein